MGQIKEYIKMALKNIKSNKGRSLLTMLGIIIGISSVILIISLGNGIKGTVNTELDSIAGGQLYLYISGDAKDDEWLNTDDIDAIIERVENVEGASMDLYNNTATARAGVRSRAAIVEGGNEFMEKIYSQKVIKGRYFSAADVLSGRRVCVIRECDAENMFGTTHVIGMPLELTLNGSTQDFMIVGIRENSEANLLSFAEAGDAQIRAEIPYTAMGSSFNYWIDNFYDVYIFGKKGSNTSKIGRDVMRLIEGRKNCRGKGIFAIQDFQDSVGTINSVLEYITLFTVLVAAISLLVGGIGVMNIMLVSVTERTREIGIRKALGARTRSILAQFLSESMIITAIGGFIGICIGTLGALVAGLCVGFTAAVDPVTVIIATAFSCGIGILFGVYPANKAARLSPIEALRHE